MWKLTRLRIRTCPKAPPSPPSPSKANACSRLAGVAAPHTVSRRAVSRGSISASGTRKMAGAAGSLPLNVFGLAALPGLPRISAERSKSVPTALRSEPLRDVCAVHREVAHQPGAEVDDCWLRRRPTGRGLVIGSLRRAWRVRASRIGVSVQRFGTQPVQHGETYLRPSWSGSSNLRPNAGAFFAEPSVDPSLQGASMAQNRRMPCVRRDCRLLPLRL